MGKEDVHVSRKAIESAGSVPCNYRNFDHVRPTAPKMAIGVHTRRFVDAAVDYFAGVRNAVQSGFCMPILHSAKSFVGNAVTETVKS